MCRRNDYRLGVRNGTRGTVLGVDPLARALRVLADDGVAVRLSAEYLENAHHGYAITGHTSQGATVDRTYLLATPERGGAEWAYVASTRQRVDLAVFVVHHEPERLEAALARSWGRSDAKHLALDLARGDARDHAVVAADGELERVLPERLVARLRDLRERRDRARVTARGPTGESRKLAGLEAQVVGEQLRAVEASATGWAARSEVARPPAYVLSAFGARPTTTSERIAWDRGVSAVAAYRHAHGIPVRRADAARPETVDPRGALGLGCHPRDRERGVPDPPESRPGPQAYDGAGSGSRPGQIAKLERGASRFKYWTIAPRGPDGPGVISGAMSPVLAAAARRGGIVAGALGATVLGHVATGAELRMLPVAPMLWLALVAIAVLPGFAQRAGSAFVAWGAARMLCVVGLVQLTSHAVLISAPWALGLVGHHHRPVVTAPALAIHLGVAILLTILLRHGERWLVRAAQIVVALLAPPPRRAWPRIVDAPRFDRVLLFVGWRPGARTSRGPPVRRLRPA